MDLPDRGARQHHQFLLIRHSLKERKGKDDDKAAKKTLIGSVGETSIRLMGDSDPDEEEPLTREVRLELRSAINNKLIWSREFLKEAPSLFFDEFSGRLILYWTLGSDIGKARLKEDPALAARAKELGNKDDDYLIEVFDAFAGKSVGTLLVETGKGSFDIESGFCERDWLVLNDSDNRVLIFSLKDGVLRHRFFGAHAAINPAKNQMVVENYPGELTLYDLTSGDDQARLIFGGSAAFVRFSLDGKRLFVLSEAQTAYAFDLDKLAPTAPPVGQVTTPGSSP